MLLSSGVRDLPATTAAVVKSPSSDCTLYASPTGSDKNSGTTPDSPKTFLGAAAATRPGSVVCLLAGTYELKSTFYPPMSGTPSSWITYKSRGNDSVQFVWTGGAIAQPMFKFGNGKFPSGAAYLEFRGLTLEGQNKALDGFFCHGGHHLRFIGNTINDTGGSGIGAVMCDYLTSDHNLIHHNGYLYGWTSAISYNSSQWFDKYAGFHNIISNNIISGEYDGSSHHSDGNGIILDLSNGSYDYRSANTPPALVLNNVVYGNGGRCIEAYTVTNFWIVNNTCYKNCLDTSQPAAGSITTNNTRDGYIVNNITVAWRSSNPSYDQQSRNTRIHFFANLYAGSHNNLEGSHPAQFIEADPRFLNPPQFDAKSENQYEKPLAPPLLGNGLMLSSSSPALRRGIDPSGLPGLPAAIVTDLRKHIYTDINGKTRARGGPFDLGAYETSSTRQAFLRLNGVVYVGGRDGNAYSQAAYFYEYESDLAH